jgi:ABC-type transport system involved in multi-copper enzyme maturation permease subunit
MTMLDSPALAGAQRTGATPWCLFTAELMKIRTTRTWRWFGLAVLLVTGWALLRNGVSHYYQPRPAYAGKDAIAADMMTSGQFLGVLFAMLLGVLVLTNEFHHHIAAATFMANPHRGRVIAAKLAAAGCFAALFWLASTMINLVVTPIYLRSEDISVPLTDAPVVRAVLFNLLAFLLWSALGLGLGAAVRSQVGAVVAGVIIYLVGAAAAEIAVNLLHAVYPHDWVLGAPVLAPAVASLILVTPGPAFAHAPPPWAGLLVLIGYTAMFTIVGSARIRRLDLT